MIFFILSLCESLRTLFTKDTEKTTRTPPSWNFNKIHKNRKYNISSSAPVFTFWLLLSIGNAFNFVSIIRNIITSKTNFSINLFEITATMLSYPIIVVQLILSCLSNSTFKLTNKKCPKKYMSFLSQITFNWFNELISKGYRNPLTFNDMWHLDSHNTTDYIYKKFNNIWSQLIDRKMESQNNDQNIYYIKILIPILKCFWMELLTVSAVKLIAICLEFMSPIALDRLISFMSPSNAEPQWRGLFYASLMFIPLLFVSLFNSQYEYRINLVAMRIRATLISTIYQKEECLSGITESLRALYNRIWYN
ncbi:unnamed protein product [Medioppia subpectinata]|uniref:ABC transmembrane type-1 domain-containing protein n=1 Tax=Medioppia subpectinata TaxID=1979941 RepID=A0A7R9KEB6_9ACAR|nr:unnamed protein product [Medioppia subpectinata]CAG2101813.1 unnamed protein product [Medioppia subpectinata]